MNGLISTNKIIKKTNNFNTDGVVDRRFFKGLQMKTMTVPKPYSTPTEHEYTALEVMNITGWGQPKVGKLAIEGKITRTRKGYYSRESVDAYQKDREERLAMSKPDWIIQGETP